MALRVSDCDRSARFYKQAFGLHETRRVESGGRTTAVWLRAGKAVLMLELSLRGTGSGEGSGHVLVFPTDNLEAAEGGLRSFNIAVTDRTASTLYVEDPDGHRAGLSTFPFDQTTS